MRLVLVALLSVMSGSAVAQVPRNPEACALLRADLDEAYNRFITSGQPPDVAMALRVCPESSGRIAEFSEHEAD